MTALAAAPPPHDAGETVGSYRLLSLLGTSPTGALHLAERSDGLYEKRVVVKIPAGIGSVEAVLQEREALAALDHPHVARLLDAGSAGDGRPFFVMEHVDGPPLDRFCDEQRLPIAARLALFRQLCDAIHLAHLNLVVHGDLRPGVVRVSADGAPKVVFFGASSLADTEDGAAEAATTSSDLHALGALLHDLLTGRPADQAGEARSRPSSTTASGQRMTSIAAARRETPASLRRRLSGDLDVILRRALDPVPGGGYMSALALSQEIGRHLAGEPISARAGSLPYRLATGLRKQRLLATVTACSLLGVLALGLSLLAQHRQDQRRLELAQYFGQQGAEMAEIAHVAALLPRHPTAYVRAEIRRRITEIEQDVQRLGEVAEGPASYALGRGYLALHDYPRARAHLERAWQEGFQSPDVAFSLGATLGALYGRAIAESDRLDAQVERSAARVQAAVTYRDPALAYLRARRPADGETAAHAEGMIQFFDGRLNDALANARKAAADAPWLYEARLLEATVLVEMGFAEHLHGRLAQARELYEQAGNAYRRALEIARSDAAVYAGECGRRSRLVRLEQELGTLEEASVEEALRPCDQALEIDADFVDAQVHAARIRLRWADRQLRRGEDPTADLARAQGLAAAILEHDPENPVALRVRGDALTTLAKWQWERGEEPWEALDRADGAYRAAMATRPADSELYNARGGAGTARARFLMARGRDPRPLLAEAAASYRRAVDLDPEYAAAHTNLGTVRLELSRAEMAAGAAGEPAIRAAIPSLERAVELSPSAASAHQNLGVAYLALGQDQLQRGLDPANALATADRHFRHAAELDPTYFIARHNLAVAAQIHGAYRLKAGLDPRAQLEAAVSAFDEAIEVRPTAAVSEAAKASAHLLLARWRLAGNGDPGPAFIAAAAACDRALALNPRLAEALEARAELEWLRAQRAGARQPERRRLVASGLAATRRSLEINPGQARARGIEGALLLLAAEDAAGTRRQELAAQAADRLDAVVASSAVWDAEGFRPFLEKARRIAAERTLSS